MITMDRIRDSHIHPCHNPLTDPLAKPKDTVNQGRKRQMKSTSVATPAIRSARDHRATSNLNGGTADALAPAPAPAGAAAGGAMPPGGGPAGGAPCAGAAAALSAAPQFGQWLASSLAWL